MSVLSDTDIQAYLDREEIRIEPFRPIRIQPASYDVDLHPIIKAFPPPGEPGYEDVVIDIRTGGKDIAEKYLTLHNILDEDAAGKPFVIKPGQFVLAMTAEHVSIGASLAARVEGRSSMGRWGQCVHATAGYVDPGWSGPLTLELSNLLPFPFVLYAGMGIGQISFEGLESPATILYGDPRLGSKYGASRSALVGIDGPEASRAYEDVMKEAVKAAKADLITHYNDVDVSDIASRHWPGKSA